MDDLINALRLNHDDQFFPFCNPAADRIEAQEAKIARLREALLKYDALIKHQYSGSREAMSDFTEAAQFGLAVLGFDQFKGDDQ